MEDTTTTTENTINPPLPQPPVASQTKPALGMKYDWFLDELSGKNTNLADIYHAGIKPDQLAMHKADDYWKSDVISKPFKEAYGPKAKEEFDKVYNFSKEKLEAYRTDAFDIESASMPVFKFASAPASRLQAAGKGVISRGTPRVIDAPKAGNVWGSRITSFDPRTGDITTGLEQHGYREAPDIRVQAPDGRMMSVEDYKKIDPDATFVHAVDENGTPLASEDGLNFLRPLAWGEEKKSYEEYYSGDSWNVFGSTGIDTPEWYAAKWLPKNTLNFAADVIDSAAETLKLVDNFFQTGVQSDWDKALTNIQNQTAAGIWAPTSEYGNSKWYTTEGIGDGFAQIGGQLLGMMGVAKGVMGLSKLARLGAGTRAGSTASLLWMSSLASDDFVKEARAIGLTPKEQAIAYGVYMMGMYKIQGLSELIVNPALSKAVISQAVKKFVPSLQAAKAASPGGSKLTMRGMLQAAKGSYAWATEATQAALTSESGLARVMGGFVTEAVEEDAEVFWDKGFKEAYNFIYGDFVGDPMYDRLTNRDKDARFKPSWENLPTELAASTVMGGLGGGFFKTTELFFDRDVKDRKELLALGAINNGFAKANKELDTLWAKDKILPGQKTVDVFGNPVSDPMKSKAAVAYNAMKQELKMAEMLWSSRNLNLGKPKMEERINYLNDETVTRYTSFTKDITSRLEEIDRLSAEITDTKTTLTEQQTKEKNDRIAIIGKELDDIAAGKYANRYLHEAIFRVSPAVDHIDLGYEDYHKLNSFMSARVKGAKELESLPPKEFLKYILDSKAKGLTKEQVAKATDQLMEEYGVTEDEEGNRIYPKEREAEYREKEERIKSLELGTDILTGESKKVLSVDPFDDFFASFDPITGNASITFSKQIAEQEKLLAESLKSGAKIFDETAPIESIITQVKKRIQQARATGIVNTDTNDVLIKNGLEAEHVVMPADKLDAAIDTLNGYLGRLITLLEIANENKGNFFRAAKEAAARQRAVTTSTMLNIINSGIEKSNYKEFFDTLQSKAAVLAEDTNPETNEAVLIDIQQSIHDFFKENPKEAIVHFNELMHEAVKKNPEKEGELRNQYTYLKAIINLSPRKYASVYQDALKERIDDPRTPFPAQKRNIFRITAFLTGGYSGRDLYDKYRDEDENKRVYRSNFKETIFLQDAQGGGKTLTAGTAVRIAQWIMGGKAVVFAKQSEVSRKNYDEFKNLLKIELKDTPSVNGSFESIKKFVTTSSDLKDVRYIVIDEAQQYRTDEMQELDDLIHTHNAQYKDDVDKIKILAMGDPAQYGPLHPNPDKQHIPYNIGYSIDGVTYIEATELTNFNFRSGNADVNAALDHLRNMFRKSNTISFADSIVKYDSKQKNGVLVTDNFDSVLKSITSTLGANSKDYVVISTKENLAKYQALGLSATQLLEVEQAGGRAWKKVFIDLPFDITKLGGGRSNEISQMLTAVGRAQEMVVIANKPGLALKTVEGASLGKDSQFKPEQLTELREQELKAYENIGLEVIPKGDPQLAREESKIEVKTQIKSETTDLSSDELAKINQTLETSLGKLPSYVPVHTFYNFGATISPEGVRTDIGEKETQLAKRKFFTTNEFPFEADEVRYELRMQKNQFPTSTYNTIVDREDAVGRAAEKMVMFAKFIKDGAPVGEFSIGGLSIKDFKIPLDDSGNKVVAVPFNPTQSEQITTALKAEFNRAASSASTVNQYKKIKVDRERGTQRDKYEINLDEFIANHPFANYSTRVWHVTVLGKEKVPYIFFSYGKSSKEIETALISTQSSQFSERVRHTELSLDEEQIRKFEANGIFSIPLEGGKSYPFYDYLQNMRKDRAEKELKQREFWVDSNQAYRIQDDLNKLLSTENPQWDIDTKTELSNKKSFLGSDKQSQVLDYIRRKAEYAIQVAKSIRPYKPDPTYVAKKGSSFYKAVEIKKQDVPYKFRATEFMMSMYDDMLRGDTVGASPDSKKGKLPTNVLAKEALELLRERLFPQGWMIPARIVKGSTKPVDAPFGATTNTRGNYTVTNLFAPPFPVLEFPIDKIMLAGKEEAPYKMSLVSEQVQVEPKLAKDKEEVSAEKDDDTGLSIGEYVSRKEKKQNLSGVMTRWFSQDSDFIYFGEFTRAFRNKVYNTIFNLQTSNPRIVTEYSLNEAINALRDELRSEVKRHADFAGTDKQRAVRALLNKGNDQRKIYYAHAMFFEFDVLMKQYFPAIEKDSDGNYGFVPTRFEYNQMSDNGHTLSHLDTGSKMVALHIFNTPFIESIPVTENGEKKIKHISRRTLNREDYVQLIRDMGDNNINSFDKAVEYFSLKGSEPDTTLGKIKRSIYQRFLADKPLMVSDLPNNSIISASSNDADSRVANNTITALLSFLSSGNVVEYTKVYMHGEGLFETTGRFTSNKMSRSYFRNDLEASIRAVMRMYLKKKESGQKATLPSAYKQTSSGEKVTFVFKDEANKDQSVHVTFEKGSANPYKITQGERGKPFDSSLIGGLFKAIGLGAVDHSKYAQIAHSSNLAPVLMSIGKFFDLENEDADIFTKHSLFAFEEFALMMQGIKDVQSAYGYKLLGKDRVNLVSLAAPYARSNQRIKEYQDSPIEGPLKTLDVVKGDLTIEGYLVKEGFQVADSDRSRANADMTLREQFKYDFRDLYLGALAKQTDPREKVNVPFSPMTFADKTLSTAVIYSAEWLPITNGVVNMEVLKKRYLDTREAYYFRLGQSILEKWNIALAGIGKSLPIKSANSSEELINALTEINKMMPSFSQDEIQKLIASDLKRELMYGLRKQKGEFIMTPIKASFMSNLTRESLEANAQIALRKYKQQFYSMKIEEAELQAYLRDIKINLNDALESYFWNWNWTSLNFTALNVGPVEQYGTKDEYSDRVKRASQTSTHRYRMIERSNKWVPDKSAASRAEGRKVAKTSKTAIITDFILSPQMISYMGPTPLKVYDGLAFHNGYAKMMMDASYGGPTGFQVGANLKPISTYMDESTGVARFDKYASFEITPQMAQSHGDRFITTLDKVMKTAVPFGTSKGIVAPIQLPNGGIASNLYELEQWGFANNLSPSQILDIMVDNGVQDDFLQEVIFDSSVKTGASHINSFNTIEEFVWSITKGQSLSYLERANSERGLILDANKSADGATATLPTQHVGAYLQHPSTEFEAIEIMKAIEKLGDLEREKLPKVYTPAAMIEPLKQRIAEQENPGFISQILANSEVPPINNFQILKKAFSSYASFLSKRTIKIKMAGGQQVMAPGTGVFRVNRLTGLLATSEEINTGDSKDIREMLGFDAFKTINGETISIRTLPVWLNLVQAWDSKNYALVDELRKQLADELSSGGWTTQIPETVISPVHLSKYHIPYGAQIGDVNPKSLGEWSLMAKFKRNWIEDEAILARYDELQSEISKVKRTKTFGDEQARQLMIQTLSDELNQIKLSTVTPMIDKDLEKYTTMYRGFLDTLTILAGRIPGTTMHSILPLKVVGFAWGADNRFHVHPDVLILQGSDQDIDKGNLLMYEPDTQGEVVIPNTLEEATGKIQIKNYIVKMMLQGATKPGVLIVSTMPTATAAIDEKLETVAPDPDAEFQSSENPISNNKKFVEGQMAKDAVGSMATGLKVFNGLIFSARQRGKLYDHYIPQSTALSKGGLPMSITGDIKSLQYFDEFIQAALDNAKDPKLAKAAMNSDNAQIVNALGLFAYTPAQTIDFLTNPQVRSLFIEYAQAMELKTTRDFVSIKQMIADKSITNPSPELQDLAYLQEIGEKMFDVGTVFSLNKELPNDLYKAYQFNRAFKSLSSMTPKEFINLDETERKARIGAFNLKNPRKDSINLLEILEDNRHMLSYLTSFVTLEDTWRTKVKMYDYIMTLADAQNKITSEAKFNSIVEFVYGLAVDSFLRDTGTTVTINGKVYALGQVVDSDEAKGRISFMKDFPDYFGELNPVKTESNPYGSGSIKEYITDMLIDDTVILKPFGNIREYTPEKLEMAIRAMDNANKMVETPNGDSELQRLLFMYSLIKDKEALTGTSYTELFTYDKSGFVDFDNYVSTRFSSQFFATDESFRELNLLMKMASIHDWKMSKDEEDIAGSDEGLDKRSAMRENRFAIPYSSNPQLNGIITADSFNKKTYPVTLSSYTTPVYDAKAGVWRDLDSGKIIGSYSAKLSTPEKKTSDKVKKKKKTVKKRKKTGRDGNSKGRKFSSLPMGSDPELAYKASRNKISHGMISRFATMLGERFGVPVKVMTEKQMVDNYGPGRARAKGLTIEEDGTVIINSDKVTLDTPIHEISHLFILGLEKENKPLYDKIMRESLKHPYAQTIREMYPRESEEYIAMETFATLSGLASTDKVLTVFNKSWFQRMKDAIKEFMEWVARKLNFSPIFEQALSINDSLMSVIDKVGESAISALKLTPNETATLDLLGVRLVPANSRLSAIRNRLRTEKRIEKICD